MSDSATLVERLDAARMVLALGDMYPQHEAALIDSIARIAELEAERDRAERERFRFGALNKGLSNRIAELEAAGIRASNEFSIALRDSRVRIAELEAGLDRAVELERNERRAKVRAAVLAEREVCERILRTALEFSEGQHHFHTKGVIEGAIAAIRARGEP